jgi:PAS domain S-box-containing protein
MQDRLEQFLDIVEGSQDGILYWDISPPLDTEYPYAEQVAHLERNSRLDWCNSRAAQLLGYPDRASLVAENNADLMSMLGMDAGCSPFIESGYQSGEAQYSFTNLLGDKKSLDSTFQALISDGQLLGIWCLLQDVTNPDELRRQLRTSHELLADTESLVGLGSWSRDFLSGEMTFSQELPRLFGLQPRGRPYTMDDFREVVHPADLGSFLRPREDVLAQHGARHSSYRVLMPDGSIRHMRAISFVSRNTEGEMVRMLGTVQDVTESRLENERRRAHYLDHPDPMFLIELDEAMPVSLTREQQRLYLVDHSRIADCNRAMLELLSFKEEQVIGQQADFVGQLWELNAGTFCENSYALKNRVVKLRRPDRGGEVAWIKFDASGIVEGTALSRIWCCLRDVTELVQARNQLQSTVNERTRKLYEEIERRKRNERQLRQQAVISAHMSESVIIWDREGRIVDWNEGANRLFGYSLEEALGCGFDLLNPEAAEDPRPRDMRAWFRHNENWGSEVTFIHRGGREVICESNITPLRDESDQIISFIEVSRDITERKAYDLRLAVAKQEAERANQAKSQFLWAMSHELRTPLNAILGFSQMLERAQDGPMSELQKSYMDHIRSGGEHLLRLVNDVLDLAKIEAGEFGLTIAPTDPVEVCREAIDLIMPLANDRKISVNTELDNAVHILADYTRLKQVLVNLLSNGVKYNCVGGVLKVSLRQGVGKVRIEISDTGEGIEQDRIPELFEPFNRLGVTDAEVEGAGLGLPISSRLVAAMDAHLGVDSVVGEGSTFWLEFAMVGPEYQLALDW